MATYQYTTSARQEKALDWMVRRENKGRANGALVTKQQLVDAIFDNAFKDYDRQFQEQVGARVREEFQKATAAKQASVLAALGVNPDTEE